MNRWKRDGMMMKLKDEVNGIGGYEISHGLVILVRTMKIKWITL